jgi:cytochrome c biogenesis protein CcdA
VNQQKVSAWHLILAGAVLMLAYGLGLLLWIWALRLLLVQLPTAAMRQEIRRPLPTPLLA